MVTWMMDTLLYIGAGLILLNIVIFGTMWVIYLVEERKWRYELRKIRGRSDPGAEGQRDTAD